MPAAVGDKFHKVGVAGTLTTLAAPGKAEAAASINVASATNWPTDTSVVFAIRVVDSDGALVAGTYTEWEGTVSGNAISGLTLRYGTDQVYAAGATTQVFIPVSAEAHEDLIDGILAEHRQDGSHKLVDTQGAADAIILDDDGDTTISAPTDDQIDIEVAGADDFRITANALTALAGSAIVLTDAGALTTTGEAMLKTIRIYTFDGTDVFIDGVDQNNGDNTVDWTKPSGLKYVRVTVIGGGGGGAGAAATAAAQISFGTPGGAGGASIEKIAAGSLGATEVVTVGAGGAGGGAGSGTGGGTTSFGSHLSATGGSGGTHTAATGTVDQGAVGAAGGLGSGGNLNIAGGSGTATFGIGSTLGRIFPGDGGASLLSAGGKGAKQTTGGAGLYGAGGGGVIKGASDSGTNTGGAGGSGVVIVEEYF